MDRFKDKFTRYIEQRERERKKASKTSTIERECMGGVEKPAPHEAEKKRKLELLRQKLRQMEERRTKIECDLVADGLSEDFETSFGFDEDYYFLQQCSEEIPGEFVETECGKVWVNEVRVDLMTRYGNVLLADSMLFDKDVVECLFGGAEIRSFDLKRAVFVDLETTGLELATATIPFLIGVGVFSSDGFLIRQLFVDRIENESAVLGYFRKLTEGYNQIVTFNGKSYDVPLIKTRFIFNRLETDIEKWLHLDLLHLIRRLYRRRIRDCSLVSCERNVLGFYRESDIPGQMIPSVYLSYLRLNMTEKSKLMPLIFHHNLQDIKAMVGLAGCIALLVKSHPEQYDKHHPEDLLSLARVEKSRGMVEKAHEIWDYAKEVLEGNGRVESLVELAKHARRREDYHSAVGLLEMAIEEGGDIPQVHLMLSKIYEHNIGNFEKALKHARLSMQAEDEISWQRRIERLRRKIKSGSH